MSIKEKKRLRVLLTNDDGPPHPESPFIETFYNDLVKLGWDVSVCIPDGQRSWISKAHFIKDDITATFYDPVTKETTKDRKKETDWVLLSASPASCVNIGLYHMFRTQPDFDIVIAGPNFGRNTSSAFMMSSGTIGGAMDGTLSGLKAFALSFAFFSRNFEQAKIDYTCDLAAKLLFHMVQQDWPDQVDMYNINFPFLAPPKEGQSHPDVLVTSINENRYGSYPKTGALFARIDKPQPATTNDESTNDEMSVRARFETTETPQEHLRGSVAHASTSEHWVFKWKPSMTELLQASGGTEMDHGTDGWAITHRKISVTPLRSTFASVDPGKLQTTLKLDGLFSKAAL